MFVKEVQQAVLDGRADLAVHSAKDLPSETPAGLVLAAIPERGDPRDALVGAARSYLPAAAQLIIEPGRSIVAIVTDGLGDNPVVVPNADVVLAEGGLSSFPIRGRSGGDGKVTVAVDAGYLVDLNRTGLKLSGGKSGGSHRRVHP